SALLGQLRMVRAIGARVDALAITTRNDAAWLAAGQAMRGEQPLDVRLCAVHSLCRPESRVAQAHTPHAIARLEKRAGGDASAATATLFDQTGAHTLPAIYESAHRQTLRTLLAQMDSASTPPPPTAMHADADALRALAADVALVARLDAG
ncbi:MAG: hypothetical protein ACKOUM_11455, partial [Sphingopyxis sp.]